MEKKAPRSSPKGLVSWASLAQGVCLSAILATRDAVTPLKVVLTAALLNCLGDLLLCCWPLQRGVAGAAWATALSTLMGFSLMLRALQRKQILPSFRLRALKEAQPVLEYATRTSGALKLMGNRFNRWRTYENRWKSYGNHGDSPLTWLFRPLRRAP